MYEAVIGFIVFMFGMVFTSFFILVGMRIPKNESINGRSHCDQCEALIPWYGLVPLFGWMFVGGKCRVCGASVSIKYPVYEFIGGMLYVVGFMFLYPDVLSFMVYAVFVSLMIIVSISDIEYMVVPDTVLIVFFPILLVLSIVAPIGTWYDGLLGGVFGFVFMVLIAYYGKKRFKQDALGGGDIKLYVLIGLFLGWQLVFLSLFFAALLGIIIGKSVLRKMNPIPFVPFIFAGSLLAYWFGMDLLTWYGGLFL